MYVHSNVHTYVRTYAHTYVRTYIHMYIRICIHTYMALNFNNPYKPLGFRYETCLQNLTNSNRYTQNKHIHLKYKKKMSQYTSIHTYLLTPWSRVLLDKLTGSAASQEIPRIFRIQRFITVLTSARHLSLS